ncbi:MAG: ketoacyl-ACP synthase III [Candidatus Omnitrophica bacterium]|nr:ketoacyl-ACP synthase III [Candidatus Omnitrophota bacterium]
MYRARIISTGYYLPERVVTNKELEKLVDTTDEWITTRTGIKERHIAAAGESSSDMGIRAARWALEKAHMKPEEIDALICATATPDHSFPATSCLIQKALKFTNAFAFDVSAACSGFLYALTVAETMLLADKAKTVLVVATEKLSSVTDWTDRSTCVLFGDGAGAAILKKENGERGILSTYLKSDGTLSDLLMVPAGGSRKPASEETIKNREHYLRMDGNEVFRMAVHKMIEAVEEAIKRAGIKTEDVKFFVPHQANLRIIDAIAKRLKIKPEQMFVNLYKTGNTSAASIAIAISEAEEQGLIKSGDIIVLVSFGAGFTWGGIALRW